MGRNKQKKRTKEEMLSNVIEDMIERCIIEDTGEMTENTEEATENTGTMTEMTTKNKDEIRTTHVLCHCRTKYNIKSTTFVWSIDKFWDIYLFYDTLTSSSIEGQHFKLQMKINKEKEKLNISIYHSDIKLEAQLNIQRYIICIQDMESVTHRNWKTFNSNSNSLLEVCLKTLRINRTELTGTTLSICFKFETCENVLHSITNEIILEMQPLTADTKDFTYTNTSSAFIICVIDEQELSVKRSSLELPNSTVFNKMLEKFDAEQNPNKRLKIRDVTFEYFSLLISYLECQGVFDFGLIMNDFMDQNVQNYNREVFHNILVAADIYDVKDLKVWCEKCLIERTDKDNVMKHLDIALTRNAVNLESYAKRFIRLHLDDIMNTSEFVKMSKIDPEVISDILKQKLLKEDALYYKNNDNNCNN